MEQPCIAAGSVHTPAKHTLGDWLALHQMSQETCICLLDQMPFAATHNDAAAVPPSMHWQLDVESAWNLVCDALGRSFPSHRRIVDDTFLQMRKILVDRPGDQRKAVTIDNGPDAYPTILYSYPGDPAALLIIAHEFGHALQLRMSEGRFVVPVIREAAAFLAERAVLDAVEARDARRHADLARASRLDDMRYFGKNRRSLEHSLARMDAPYRYAWNYPIARLLACLIGANGTAQDWLAIFRGAATIGDLVATSTHAIGRPSWRCA